MSLYVRSDSGLWVYTENLNISRYYWSCYFGMAAGCLIFLISFVGCMGTLIDSRLLFGIVSILMDIMFLIALSDCYENRENRPTGGCDGWTNKNWIHTNNEQNSKQLFLIFSFSLNTKTISHHLLAHLFGHCCNHLRNYANRFCLANTWRRPSASWSSLRA